MVYFLKTPLNRFSTEINNILDHFLGEFESFQNIFFTTVLANRDQTIRNRFPSVVDVGDNVFLILVADDQFGVVTEEVYLQSSITELHNNSSIRSEPLLHKHPPTHRRPFTFLLFPSSSFSPMYQMLFHVLTEVHKKGSLLSEAGGGGVDGVDEGLVAQVVVGESSLVGGYDHSGGVVEEDANVLVGELEAEAIFVGVVNPFGDPSWLEVGDWSGAEVLGFA